MCSALYAVDHFTDFQQGFFRIVCQMSDFLRDDGESAACIPGACCLNGGIQCEKVNGFRNLIDDIQCFADFPRLCQKFICNFLCLACGTFHITAHSIRRFRDFSFDAEISVSSLEMRLTSCILSSILRLLSFKFSRFSGFVPICPSSVRCVPKDFR